LSLKGESRKHVDLLQALERNFIIRPMYTKVYEHHEIQD